MIGKRFREGLSPDKQKELKELFSHKIDLSKINNFIKREMYDKPR